MDFTAYTAKLEPFLLMSKSAKGAAAAKLVRDATGAQGVYVFAQLLDVPNIREVRYMSIPSSLAYLWSWSRSQLQKMPEHEPSYALLELFAHGTYQDYKCMPCY
jgi:COP9 signalosome complex subunit 7